MIEVRHLTKTFDGLKALDDLSVSFTSGITGLVGQNGAGKSTLLRIIAGVYHQDEGEVYVDKIPADSPDAKSDVFFLSDDPYAPKGANIAGTLDFYQGLFDIDVAEFNRLIDGFGLPRGKAVTSFSKGMRRQLFVAIALATNAHHLLLDEAFDGLDPVVIDSIKGEIISSTEKGKTVIISSHNIFALQRLADRFVVLSSGRLGKQEETAKMGNEFIKFQVAFDGNVTETNLKEAGFNVVSYKKIGSVTHMVLLGDRSLEQAIKGRYPTIFIEPVAIDPDEIVMLEMILAKQRGGQR